MKTRQIFLVVLFLIGCNYKTRSQREKADFINLSSDELLILRGVSIDSRGQKIISVIDIAIGDSVYVIPTTDIGYSDSIRLKKFFDIKNFCNIKKIDTNCAFTYLDSLTNKILKVFRKARVKSILCHPSSGDFIIFTPCEGNEMVYKYSDNIMNNIWKKFFDTAEMVKKGWYKSSIVNK